MSRTIFIVGIARTKACRWLVRNAFRRWCITRRASSVSKGCYPVIWISALRVEPEYTVHIYLVWHLDLVAEIPQRLTKLILELRVSLLFWLLMSARWTRQIDSIPMACWMINQSKRILKSSLKVRMWSSSQVGLMSLSQRILNRSETRKTRSLMPTLRCSLLVPRN